MSMSFTSVFLTRSSRTFVLFLCNPLKFCFSPDDRVSLPDRAALRALLTVSRSVSFYSDMRRTGFSCWTETVGVKKEGVGELKGKRTGQQLPP